MRRVGLALILLILLGRNLHDQRGGIAEYFRYEMNGIMDLLRHRPSAGVRRSYRAGMSNPTNHRDDAPDGVDQGKSFHKPNERGRVYEL